MKNECSYVFFLPQEYGCPPKRLVVKNKGNNFYSCGIEYQRYGSWEYSIFCFPKTSASGLVRLLNYVQSCLTGKCSTKYPFGGVSVKVLIENTLEKITDTI